MPTHSLRRLLSVSLLLSLLFSNGVAVAQKQDTIRYFQLPTATTFQGGDLNRLLPAITPKSPTAAELAKYGSYPVSLYTGLPTIEIPIHQFKIGPVNVPVRLTYHASGLKVSDLGSWVGMGWSLQTGGMVSRSVQSRPDEQTNGVLGIDVLDPNTFYNPLCVSEEAEQQMIFFG
jgi:hypothetical protein